MAVATGIPEAARRVVDKQSGHGGEKGEYALELYTEVKAVVANLED